MHNSINTELTTIEETKKDNNPINYNNIKDLNYKTLFKIVKDKPINFYYTSDNKKKVMLTNKDNLRFSYFQSLSNLYCFKVESNTKLDGYTIALKYNEFK